MIFGLTISLGTCGAYIDNLLSIIAHRGPLALNSEWFDGLAYLVNN